MQENHLQNIDSSNLWINKFTTMCSVSAVFLKIKQYIGKQILYSLKYRLTLIDGKLMPRILLTIRKSCRGYFKSIRVLYQSRVGLKIKGATQSHMWGTVDPQDGFILAHRPLRSRYVFHSSLRERNYVLQQAGNTWLISDPVT